MQQYRDLDRGSSMMHKMSSGYSDELIEQLADWYSAQPSRPAAPGEPPAEETSE
jgi:cytochrome c553